MGSLACGVVSDMRVVHRRKDLTCLLFSLLLLPVYGLLTAVLPASSATGSGSDSDSDSAPSMWLLVCCMLLAGVGASGPKTLIGLMARSAVPLQHIGLAGGVLGFVGQLGGALAGSALGSVLQVRGWRAFFPLLLAVSGLCSALILACMCLSGGAEEQAGRDSISGTEEHVKKMSVKSVKSE